MDDIEAEINIPASTQNVETTTQDLYKKHIDLHAPPQYNGPSHRSGFHQSNRQCLKIIRDAMLHHNWQKAAEYFRSYFQILEDTTIYQQALTSVTREVIWRLGTEILHHLSDANNDDYNAVYNHMKNSGVQNFAKICLEQSFHLLLNGLKDEAKRHLSIADGWRYGKETTNQSLEITLIRAYCGYLEYFTWCEKKSIASAEDDVNISQEMNSCFRQASVTLQEIIGQPGIWDPFVLSYIAMLEFYNDDEGALKVLQNYAYNKDFPSNPNAHIYLYLFLKRHEAPTSKLISSLRILHSLLPSHKLMFELCSLLQQTNVQEDLEEAFRVSMDLLEFTSWKSDKQAWKNLWGIMLELKNRKRKQSKEILRKEWAVRQSLWLPLHFRPYIGRTEIQRDKELLEIKAKVLRLMGAQNKNYFRVYQKIKPQKAKDTNKKKPQKPMRSCKNVSKIVSDEKEVEQLE